MNNCSKFRHLFNRLKSHAIDLRYHDTRHKKDPFAQVIRDNRRVLYDNVPGILQYRTLSRMSEVIEPHGYTLQSITQSIARYFIST